MHIDGFLIPVPEDKKQAYLDLAQWFDEEMMKLGAIEIVEAWESDIKDGQHTDFRRAVAAEPGEKIVFSWIIWPDKPTAEAAHKAIMEDERMKDMASVPFDGRRMVFGSFTDIVNLRA